MKRESPNVHSITEIGAVAFVFVGCVLGVSLFLGRQGGSLGPPQDASAGGCCYFGSSAPCGSGLSGSGGTRH
jgi:hypothetical protein